MNFFEWLHKGFSLWRGIFSVVFCVTLSGVMISLDNPGRQVFHEVMIGTFLFPSQFALSRMDGSIRIYRENSRLKSENASLRAESDFLRQWLHRIPRLDTMEKFRSMSGMHLKGGQIIAHDAGRMQASWVVDLGSKDSVGVNMPVFTSQGIVGKIAKCYPYHSLVQLVIDPASKVSVLSDRSRARGILEANGLGQLVAKFPAGSDILKGDTLVTAGMGGVFPKGLRVGAVLGEMDRSDVGEVLRSFLVRPFQDMNSVEDLFVLLKEDRWTLEIGEEEP